jgi:hypothetical protein
MNAKISEGEGLGQRLGGWGVHKTSFLLERQLQSKVYPERAMAVSPRQICQSTTPFAR